VLSSEIEATVYSKSLKNECTLYIHVRVRGTKMKLEEYFKVLDDLRASGTINMFGAPKALQDMFGLSKAEAFEIFTAWTEEFKNGRS